MTATEFEKWVQENGTKRKSHSANRIDYVFVTMRDGLIAIFEKYGCNYHPLIQAADKAHAESYCYFREPVTVSMERI